MKEIGLRYLKFSKYLLKIASVSLVLYLISYLFHLPELLNLVLLTISLSCLGESIVLKGMSVIILARYKKGE